MYATRVSDEVYEQRMNEPLTAWVVRWATSAYSSRSLIGVFKTSEDVAKALRELARNAG
jgi:hypothetical protein